MRAPASAWAASAGRDVLRHTPGPAPAAALSASADTTAVVLGWAVYVIGQEPHIQAALQREIDTFMDAAGTSDLT